MQPDYSSLLFTAAFTAVFAVVSMLNWVDVFGSLRRGVTDPLRRFAIRNVPSVRRAASPIDFWVWIIAKGIFAAVATICAVLFLRLIPEMWPTKHLWK
jgi:hypothetical protein